MSKPHHKKLNVMKASGEEMNFLPEKLKHSLHRSGADDATSNQIVATIISDASDGISTREIYKKAFRLLKQNSNQHAARYKLKHAIMELGPTGYPFEIFVGEIFKQLKYKVKTGQLVKGECVQHEVDVLAELGNILLFAECKFHNKPGIKCDVKIPLYVHSRFRDIENKFSKQPDTNALLPVRIGTDGKTNVGKGKRHEGWLITNTQFSPDAIKYAECAGLHLLGWDYPYNNGLKDMIDRMGLYPVTCLTTLLQSEKQYLLDKYIVLCSQLLQQKILFEIPDLSTARREKVLKEVEGLCNKDLIHQ